MWVVCDKVALLIRFICGRCYQKTRRKLRESKSRVCIPIQSPDSILMWLSLPGSLCPGEKGKQHWESRPSIRIYGWVSKQHHGPSHATPPTCLNADEENFFPTVVELWIAWDTCWLVEWWTEYKFRIETHSREEGIYERRNERRQLRSFSFLERKCYLVMWWTCLREGGRQAGSEGDNLISALGQILV